MNFNEKNDELKNFKILSLSEEKKLDSVELLEYYRDLREYVKSRELSNTTVGATVWGKKLKNVTNKISMGLTKAICGGDVEFISDGQENIPDGPVLFAHTHQGLLDNFAWIPATPNHCIIFHSIKVKKILILVQLNTGLVLVNKDDKVSRMNAKLDTIKLLMDGHSVSFFPESAYLLSPNKLHLPMNYGFLDIAKKANVPIVPVVSEYTYDTSNDQGRIKKIHISFCKPIYVSHNDDLSVKLNEYEEIISTRRYELIEENGVFDRNTVTNLDYINFLKANYRVLKMGGIDINVERANLWDVSNDFYLFHHINDVEYDENGNLLDTKEARKLEKINKEHQLEKKYVRFYSH